MIMAQVQTEAKPIVNRTQALVWLRQMMLIRRFEERAEMLYQKGNKIGGFFHLYSGQEPVAVGSIGVLREDDYVITAYRDHGHALARGMTAKSAMAELLGKVTGCSKGKGGSMHFFDPRRGSSAAMRSSAATSRWRPASPSRPSTATRTGSASASSATVPSTREPSTKVQHGGPLEAAGDLRRREQYVRDGHLAGCGPRPCST